MGSWGRKRPKSEVRSLKSSSGELLCGFAGRVGRATPEGFSLVGAGAGEALDHGLAAEGARRRSGRGVLRRAGSVASFEAEAGQAFAEAAFGGERFHRPFDLAGKEGFGALDGDNQGVGGDDGVFVFQPGGETGAHFKDVDAEIVEDVVGQGEFVEIQRGDGFAARVVFRPDGFVGVGEECFVVALEFGERALGDVEEFQFRFLRGARAGGGLDDVLPGGAGGADHLPGGLAQRVVLPWKEALAEGRGGVVDEAGVAEREHLAEAAGRKEGGFHEERPLGETGLSDEGLQT